MNINKTFYFKSYMLFSLAVFYLLSFPVYAVERIVLFQSDVVVDKDAIVTITETITVESHGRQIRRGIIRELPGKSGNVLSLLSGQNDYQIVSIKKDGRPIFYTIAHRNKWESPFEIHIGGNNLISHGKHTYQITYKTDWFVDFYKNHDELYLNITGNYWRLPIDHVEVSIKLPDEVDFSSITAEAYTGRLGEAKRDYQYNIRKNTIFFETTHSFSIGEGVTTVVTWNKGVLTKPFWYLHWYENPYFYLVILMLLIQCLLLLYLMIIRRRNNRSGVIMPLFYPPKDMIPSLFGYLSNHGLFKNRFLVADIIQLAVQGNISITAESSFKSLFFSNTAYTLSLIKTDATTSYQQLLLRLLFSKSNSCHISSKNTTIIQQLSNNVLKECAEKSKTFFSGFSILWVILICIIPIFLFFYFFTLGYRFVDFYLAIYFVGSLLFLIISQSINRWYTPEGRKIQDQIDGFLLFLNATAVDRMNAIGTPPTKTPELYEMYLPFAIAAGVEARWNKQFEKIFADLEMSRRPYRSHWYIGNKPFSVTAFSSSLSSHLASSFRSSAAGGRGFSGGGRGGGGGGGR